MSKTALSPGELKKSRTACLTWIIQDVGGRCLPALQRSGSNEVKYYSERVVQKVIAEISIVMAALLLEGAIVALYLVTNAHARLGLIALFVVSVSGNLGSGS